MEFEFTLFKNARFLGSKSLTKTLSLAKEKIKEFLHSIFKSILKIFCVYAFFYES